MDSAPSCRAASQGFRFVAQTKARVFIAYVEEDLAAAKKLYAAFEQRGFRPWLDRKKLLPGTELAASD